MYNSSEVCFDEDLTFLSYNQTINKDFTMSEVLTGGLWYVVEGTGFYKCIPLFNCDRITSSDDNDNVLDDNKCLITLGDEETIISCISDDTGGIHYQDIAVYAYAPYTKLDLLDEVIVYCIVYDEYLNTLNNTLVDVLIDGTVTSQIQTNNQGVCKFTIKNPCTIQFKYNDNMSNIITIMGA